MYARPAQVDNPPSLQLGKESSAEKVKHAAYLNALSSVVAPQSIEKKEIKSLRQYARIHIAESSDESHPLHELQLIQLQSQRPTPVSVNLDTPKI